MAIFPFRSIAGRSFSCIHKDAKQLERRHIILRKGLYTHKKAVVVLSLLVYYIRANKISLYYYDSGVYINRKSLYLAPFPSKVKSSKEKKSSFIKELRTSISYIYI